MQLIIDVHNSGETPFVVYGNDSTDIRLISLREELDREALARDYAAGMRYAGVIGLIEGRPQIASGPEAGSRELEALRYAGLALVRQTFGNSIEWLNKLFSLPDTRTEFPC
jgi:hypothetical protein